VPAPQDKCATLATLAPLAAFHNDHVPAGTGGEYPQPRIGTVTQFRHLGFEYFYSALQVKDMRNAGEVDALVLTHALNLAQYGDVAQRVSTSATGTTPRHHESHAVVLA
jgi:hypothetical protein